MSVLSPILFSLSNSSISFNSGIFFSKQAWGSNSSNAGLTAPAVEKPSHGVEASLRGLFRELSAGVESQASSCPVDGGVRGGDDAPGWERSEEESGGNGTSSASVEALRAELAEISGARFGVGKMDDAAEAMETILGERNGSYGWCHGFGVYVIQTLWVPGARGGQECA